MSLNVNVDVNQHFLDYLQDWQHYYYIVIGGYGSSKSYNTAIKLVTKAMQEPKRKILVVREVFETIRYSCFDLLVEVCGALGLKNKKHYTTRLSPLSIQFKNGSEIIFKGCDDKEKLKSINGVSIIWVEECSEVNYATVKELIGRLIHPSQSNHIIYTSNPVSKSNWLYHHFFIDLHPETREMIVKLDDQELYKKRVIKLDNKYYHHSVCYDNAFSPKTYIEQLEEMQSYDKDLWRVAVLGRFGTNGKRVFPQAKVMQEFEMFAALGKIEKPLYFNGLDFGFVTSYNALVRMVVDPKHKDLYIYEEYYTRDKTDEEIAEDIKHFKDIEIKADCAEPKAIRYYKQKGFKMKPCKKFKGSRAVYTKKVKRFKNIYISTACQNTIRELLELTFKVDKNGEIIEDKFNIDPHTLSAIWYGLDTYEVTDLKNRTFGTIGGVSI